MKRKKLKRSSEDAILFGVCGGLGERFNVEPWLFRLAFLAIPSLQIVYIILAIFLD
jgi:phage shock protein PspC (stress-responsive transcriptional regulator)